MSEMAISQSAEQVQLPDVLPVLALKDVVIFPYIILPLSIGREKSIEAVDRALAEQRVIMLAAGSSFKTLFRVNQWSPVKMP